MGKQKNHGVYCCANGAAFLQIPSQASLQMSFQNPAIPASRAYPVFFLEANSWQFLHLAQGAKSRAAREASERCDFTIPCKLACEEI